MFYVTLNLPENFRSIPAGAARLQSNGAAHGAVIAHYAKKRKHAAREKEERESRCAEGKR